jgi:hypothetical protein
VGPCWKEVVPLLHVHVCETHGRILGVKEMEVAGRRNTPPPGGSLSSSPGQVRSSSRVRLQSLFWVRRELVLNKSFQASDCFPVGRKRLLIPTKVSFSKDLLRGDSGAATFAEVVMAGGGRGSGKMGQGRGTKTPAPVPPPSSSTGSGAAQILGAAQIQSQMPVAQEAPIQLGAGGNFNSNIMQQMSAVSQGMFPMMNPALWNIPMGQ